jgi:hypothetical protein
LSALAAWFAPAASLRAELPSSHGLLFDLLPALLLSRHGPSLWRHGLVFAAGCTE